MHKREKIKEELQKKASDNRIPCALARKVAEEAGATCGEVGRAADELRIKITDCELGCF